MRVTGVAEAPLGLTTGSAQSFDYDLCYQLTSGGTINNFTIGHWSTSTATTTKSVFTASASVVLSPGTYYVGFGIRNQYGTAAIDNNDWVNGWIMITAP